MSSGPVSLLVLLMLLAAPPLAAAQPAEAGQRRIDVLTGEPVRPRAAHPRPQPEIFNAPHAPRQPARTAADDPPIDILVTPQIGAGTGTPLRPY